MLSIQLQICRSSGHGNALTRWSDSVRWTQFLASSASTRYRTEHRASRWFSPACCHLAGDAPCVTFPRGYETRGCTDEEGHMLCRSMVLGVLAWKCFSGAEYCRYDVFKQKRDSLTWDGTSKCSVWSVVCYLGFIVLPNLTTFPLCIRFLSFTCFMNVTCHFFQFCREQKTQMTNTLGLTPGSRHHLL